MSTVTPINRHGRKFWMVLLLSLCLALTMTVSSARTRIAAAAPLGSPPPATMNINANGYTGTLSLTVNAQGVVTGSVYGNPIEGFWDEDAQKLTFMRIPNSSNPSTIQVYTGYMFVSGGRTYLAGSFEAFAGTGATAQRIVYGWFASS